MSGVSNGYSEGAAGNTVHAHPHCPYDVNVINGPAGVVDVYSAGNAVGMNGFSAPGKCLCDKQGSVTVEAVSFADGIFVRRLATGKATSKSRTPVRSTCSASTRMRTDLCRGAWRGQCSVNSSGSIIVTADDEAYGIYAYAHGDGNVDVTNSGSISVTSTDGGPAYGIYTYSDGTGTTTIDNSGTIATSSDGDSVGIHGNTDYDYAYFPLRTRAKLPPIRRMARQSASTADSNSTYST